MNETVRSGLIAALAILAITIVAAGIDSTVLVGEPGSGEAGGGNGGGGSVAPGPGDALDIPFLPEFVSILVIVAVLLFIAIVFVYWREALLVFFSVVVFLGVVLLLHHVLVSPGEFTLPPLTEPANESGGPGTDGGTEALLPPLPVLLIMLVLGLALSVGVVALFRRGRPALDRLTDEHDSETDRVEAVGKAAGRAADRLEHEEDTANEVYRAWREMTALLDVANPETSTPGEFATDAIEVGLGEEDVDQLTRLFEDVRYGEANASDAYEQQAITIFRRIEKRYTEEDL